MSDKLIPASGVRLTYLRSSVIRLWLLPVATCFVNLLTAGTELSSSLIVSELIEKEHYSRFVTSLQFSARGTVAIILAPVAAYLSTRMSYGALFSSALFLFCVGRGFCYFSTSLYVISIFNGFIAGGGILIVSVLVPSIINITFKAKKSTAMGIATLGTALGGFFWPHLMQFFIDNYGLNGMFMLSAAVSLNALIGILYISSYMTEVKMKRDLQVLNSVRLSDNQEKVFSSAEEASSRKQTELSCTKVVNSATAVKSNGKQTQVTDSNKTIGRSKSFKQILSRIITSRAFYMLSITNCTITLAFAAINQLVVDYMSDKGLSRQHALLMINAFAFGGIVGRICLGWITDSGFLSARLHKALTIIVFASTLIFTTVLYVFYGLWICFFVLGICHASIMITNSVQYAMYFGAQEMVVALSANRFILGFVQLFRTPLTGLIRDVSNTYNYFFIVLSLFLYFLSVLWVFEERLLNKNKKYRKLDTEDPDEI